MSKKTKNAVPVKGAAPAANVKPIPENLPEELLPLYDWWTKSGLQTVITLVIIVIVVGGFYGVRSYRQGKITEANRSLISAGSLEELEAAVAKSGGTKAGNAIRLRLAKAYYDAEKYEDALNTYKACLARKAPDGFKEIAELGVAVSLEGMKDYDKALAAYQAFEKGHADHFLIPQATMGVARVTALKGDKAGAKKILENLKARATGKTLLESQIAQLDSVIDRYTPRAQTTLFEAANAAAEKAAKKPAAPVTSPEAKK
jgi:predicted negative regulator of RcsB-dependent stress response